MRKQKDFLMLCVVFVMALFVSIAVACNGDTEPTTQTADHTGLTASAINYGQPLSESTLSGGDSRGTYAWTDPTVVPTVSGGAAGYSVTFTPNEGEDTDWSGLTTTVTVTVNKASATVTAAAKTKVYGEADPELTYTATGLLGSDTLTGSLAREEGTDVGTYAITQGTLANENYNITFVGAEFTVTPKALTVTADAKTKVYGEEDPELTYTAEGLVGTDTLTGSLTREEGTDVGTYDITQGTLANKNYEITFVGAEFTITKASATPDNSTLAASDVELGQPLSSSVLSGGDPRGTYAWKDGSVVPALSDSGVTAYEVTFTPNDTKNIAWSNLDTTVTVIVFDPRVIATLTEDGADSNGEIKSQDTNYSTFAFDAEKSAYKWTPTGLMDVNTSTLNAITVRIGSETANKIDAGCEKYTYLAMDMCFSSADIEEMIWWMATEDKTKAAVYGRDSSVLIIVDMQTKTSLDYMAVEAGKWYTVYLQTGGLYEQFGQKWFISQGAASDGLCHEFWLKNIRFADEVDADSEMIASLTKDGANCNGEIKSQDGNYSSFAFDAEKGAYKWTPTALIDGNTSTLNAITIGASTATATKIVNGCGIYTYLAMDMCFSSADIREMIWWIGTEDGSKGAVYGKDSDVLIIVDADTNERVDHTSVEAGKWYTIYLQTGNVFEQFSQKWFISQGVAEDGSCHEFWLKNIRFTNVLDAAA